jgi:type 1 fimbria pilin
MMKKGQIHMKKSSLSLLSLCLILAFSAAAHAAGTVHVTTTYQSAPCSSPSATALPLEIDGEGEFCRVTSGDISNINSWNMQLVEINGETLTNTWSKPMTTDPKVAAAAAETIRRIA